MMAAKAGAQPIMTAVLNVRRISVKCSDEEAKQEVELSTYQSKLPPQSK